MKFYALNLRERLTEPYVEVNATSNSKDWAKALSPFILGPVTTINGVSKTVENAWQYSKIYPEHWDEVNKCPKPEYWGWRQYGFDAVRANRYPMGKDSGKVPVGTWIGREGEKGYLMLYKEAKAKLYVPTYLQGLRNSQFYGTFIKFIADAFYTDTNVVFRDYDVFNHYEANMTLDQVLYSPDHRYGHGFILVSEANRFIESQSIDFSEFTIKQDDEKYRETITA